MNDWHQQIQNDDDYWSESVKIDFAVNLDRLMRRVGITKTTLAKKINSSQAYITKVLRGDSNLTIESMVKLTRAAEGSLHVSIVHQASTEQWMVAMEKGRDAVDKSADSARMWIERLKLNSHRNEPIEITA